MPESRCIDQALRLKCGVGRDKRMRVLMRGWRCSDGYGDRQIVVKVG